MKPACSALLLGLLLPLSAHADWDYEISGSATGLYGYSDLEKRFRADERHSQGTGDFHLNTAVIYTYNDVNFVGACSLFLKFLIGGNFHYLAKNPNPSGCVFLPTKINEDT